MKLLRKVFNTPKLLALFVLFVVLTAASGYAAVEDKSLFSGLWWVVVTFCTVGYGDMYPNLVLGKVIAMVLMLSAVFVLAPVITAHMSARMIVDSNAFTHEEQELIKQNSEAARELLGKIQVAQEHLDSDLDRLLAAQIEIQASLQQMTTLLKSHGFSDS